MSCNHRGSVKLRKHREGERKKGGIKKRNRRRERDDLAHELISSHVASVFISHKKTRANHKELLSFTLP